MTALYFDWGRIAWFIRSYWYTYKYYDTRTMSNGCWDQKLVTFMVSFNHFATKMWLKIDTFASNKLKYDHLLLQLGLYCSACSFLLIKTSVVTLEPCQTAIVLRKRQCHCQGHCCWARCTYPFLRVPDVCGRFNVVKRRTLVEAEGVRSDVTRRIMYCIQICRVDICFTDEMGISIRR